MATTDNTQAASGLFSTYLKQPSTWQGLALLGGSIATYFGIPVDQVATGAGLVLSAIQILRNDATPAQALQDVVAKALEDKVNGS